MNERPILFSAPMVRAVLAGTKTQTRRIFKLPRGTAWYNSGGLRGEETGDLHDLNGPGWCSIDELSCPYGEPGDRLWVRETFYCNDAFYPDGVDVNCMWREVDGQRVAIPIDEQRKDMLESMYYRADGEPDFGTPEGPTPWRPSIHMPRWASRITLEVTGTRVERLQAISEADAIAEGVVYDPGEGGTFFVPGLGCASDRAAGSFRLLWESINGPDSWDVNPWVWAIEFKPLEQKGSQE